MPSVLILVVMQEENNAACLSFGIFFYFFTVTTQAPFPNVVSCIETQYKQVIIAFIQETQIQLLYINNTLMSWNFPEIYLFQSKESPPK